MYRKIQFDVDRYPVSDYKFVPYSTMGIMAKELEMQQMVQMLQAIPKDSPAFNVILLAMMQNSSIHNRDQIVFALTQGQETNPEMEQMEQMGIQLTMQQAQANIAKTQAEAQEEQAKAQLHMANAAALQSTELDMVEKQQNIKKVGLSIDKMAADTDRQRSETARNIPEVDHLKSETILNLAKARQAGTTTNINTRVQ
jgi:hypothetical protein